MHVIALTGGIASGKSTLCDALRRLGAPVIDADQISRELTAADGAALPYIRAAFGDGVFTGDSRLNRKALAQIVFEQTDARKKLESILHPMIALEMHKVLDALRRAGETAAVIDVPLLYESGMESMADEVWCAYIPKKEQISRLRVRDHLTEKQARQRLESQMDPQEKCRRANHTIRTDGSVENSAALVASLWEETLRTLKSQGGNHID